MSAAEGRARNRALGDGECAGGCTVVFCRYASSQVRNQSFAIAGSAIAGEHLAVVSTSQDRGSFIVIQCHSHLTGTAVALFVSNGDRNHLLSTVSTTKGSS